MKREKYILLEFDKQEKLASGFHLLNEKNIQIADIISPYPVDELNGMLPERKSYIGIAGLLAGIIALAMVLYFQIWVTGEAYPLVYGGKPFHAWLSFIPVLFESVVLIAAIFIVLTFLIEIRIMSKRVLIKKKPFITDKFALVILDENITESDRSFIFSNYKTKEV